MLKLTTLARLDNAKRAKLYSVAARRMIAFEMIRSRIAAGR